MEKKIKIGNFNAILHKSKKRNSPGIVMVHGLGGEGFEKEFEDIANSLCENGYTILRFLFSGYENDDLIGLTISKEISELRLAIDFLESENIDKKKVGIIAQSLGCVVSILLNDKRVRAMALLAPLVSVKEIISGEITINQIEKFEEQGFMVIARTKNKQKRKVGIDFWNDVKRVDKINKSQIEAIRCPLLIIHGTKDKTVAYQESETIYKWANKPKQLKLIKNGKHVTISDPKIRKEVSKYLLNFFDDELQ